ncbi:conditioned medium factor-like isoform X2 [Dysidea avara]|uniref:conditioned medium factor-like isoform X2 n=1 Tax=Dysidea avara TaxID=196820 RepID=UPI003330FF8E
MKDFALLWTTLSVLRLIQVVDAVDYYQYRNLAGSAAEFPHFAPPPLEATGMHSRYHVLPLLTLDETSPEWKHTFPVDHCDIFAVTVFGKDPKSFKLVFTSPDGKSVTANIVADEELGYGTAGSYPCRTFLFNDPVPSVGQWTISVTSNDPSTFPAKASLIASFYPSDLILQAYVPAENLIAGRSVQIIALLPSVVKSKENINSTRSVAALDSAVTTVYLPDGTQKNVEMKEGPRSISNDLYATFEVPISGIYKNLVQLSGELSDGTKFIRSLWYVFTVAHPSVNITGDIRGALRTHEISQRELIDFTIDVSWYGPDASYRAFAQVWGTGENNEEVPVAWISGLVDVQRKKRCLFNCHYVKMQLDSCWLELVNAKPPLVLKSISLEDLKGYITVSKMDEIKVITEDDNLMNWSPSLKAKDIEIDWEMKEGYNPYRIRKSNTSSGETGKLVLLHGYCAGADHFECVLDYFTDYIVYNKSNHKNMVHDEYAKEVLKDLHDKGVTRFSVYGHSQGGAVATHLYTYYISGIDAVSGGHIVQTLGTPYLGCPLAGLLALIGDTFFGIGCGANGDLTYDGAARWASKLPMDKQLEVYCYTTQLCIIAVSQECSVS